MPRIVRDWAALFGPLLTSIRGELTNEEPRPPLKVIVNGLLALASVGIALVACELAARVGLPRYALLAEPPPARHDPVRMTWMDMWPHGDTGVEHQLLYNNLGGRQHRNFAANELRDGVNVAFFGDSYTENRRLPAQYSFTEPLDHLLNVRRGAAGAAPAQRVNVLNFGMGGTGPGAQYLFYQSLPMKKQLRHVVYVHCPNDMVDLRSAGVWRTNAVGDLVARTPGDPGPWLRALSRLHLTYLALDTWRRLVPGPEPGGGGSGLDHGEADAVFRAVVLRWRREVEANGGTFHVALLPLDASDWFAAAPWPESLDIVDLGACFDGIFPGWNWWTDLRFRKDGHWNAFGNLLAAHCLVRFLEPRLGLAALDGDGLARQTHAYYEAFAEDDGWPGQRWTPKAPWALPRPFENGEAQAIVGRYLALADDSGERRRRAIAQVRATPPVVARGGWRVHVSVRERIAVFVKASCAEAEPASRLFAQPFPPNTGVLGRSYIHEYGELPVHRQAVWWTGGDCATAIALPLQPVPWLLVGEYRHGRGGPTRWQAAVRLDAPERVAATTARYRREFHRIAAGTPAVRGRWNIHVDGAELAFLKAPCRSADTGEFFIRAWPAHPELARGPDGFILWEAFGQPLRFFDDKCLVKMRLPQWPVAAVRTGQEWPRDGQGWQVQFHVDPDRFRHAYLQTRHRPAATAGGFRIYWTRTREDRDAVTYVKTPCGAADVAPRFFLHALTTERGRSVRDAAIADLDFDFDNRGVVEGGEGGRCVAVAPVPVGVRRVRTGQFAADAGVLWQAEL